ncbi:MAG: factor-independent urate hydroxylase [Candidatus Acidiferrum sp.]|jgi:urate oxidase
MTKLAENSYGKSRVRLAKLKRYADHNDFHEWTIEISLQGDFDSCFVAGDNSKILPTDTMKNTVYSLARASSAGSMEEFGKELAAFFLDRNPQVSATRITLAEKFWDHLHTDGKRHPTTFVQPSGEQQTTEVAAKRNAQPSVCSGLENLVIMKTANSAFAGFLRDSLTTLPEANDRLFATSVRARWNYSSPHLPFPALRSRIRQLLLSAFAEHASKSVQHTLYAMGESALAQVPEIDDIELIMPNKHYLLADLSRFGQDNPNEIFVPIDEPHGTIEARLCRQG